MLPLLWIFFNPSVLRTPPLYFAMQNTEEEGNTFLCVVFVLLPCHAPQYYGAQPEKVDIRFCFLFCQYFFQPPRPTGTPPISSTMSRGRGNLNLSSPRPVFSNPSVLRTPPLYFAMQNTEEEVNIFLCIVFVLLPCLP